MIYTVLADNVERPGRTKASANYKTFSALAMAFAPAIQYVVLLAGPVEDQWTSGTFDALILPGWLILPVVALSIFNLRPVGEKISDIPNVDEVSQRLPSAANLDEAWLDEIVMFKCKRRLVVALAVNLFFIATLLANGMTVRYFNLYYTQILRFSPKDLCLLNCVCRLFIAATSQIASPLAHVLG